MELLHRDMSRKHWNFLKKKGRVCNIEIDPDYVPDPIEHKESIWYYLEQGRNELNIDKISSATL